jgi:phosphoglycolate phosphatase
MNELAHIPFDLVVFDLDGTLVDTGPDLTAALNHALQRLGRQRVTEPAVRDMIGHGARKLLERGLSATGGCSEALIEAGFADFMDYYAAHICDHSRPFAGVEAALQGLRKAGRRTAICTNKPEGLAKALVSAIGWDGHFAAILGGDSIDVRKPDPRHLTATIQAAGGGRAAYVGDSIVDVDAARAADVPVIAVSFGFADRPATELGADILIHHYDELLTALGSL